MKRFMIGFACLVLAAGVDASTSAAQSSLAGEWLGGYEITGRYTAIKTQFNPDGTAIKGTLEIQQRQGSGVPLNQVRFSSSALHFESSGSAAPLVFDGQLRGDLITGSVQSGSGRGTFHLVHSGLAKSFDEYLGNYQIGRDSYVNVWRFPSGMFAGGVMYEVKDLSNPALRMGYLFPISQTAFVAGPEQFTPNPVEISATFVKDERGQLTLKWKPTGLDRKSVV